MKLTQNHKDIIDLLKILGTDSRTIIASMLAVQDDKKAEQVLRRVLDLDNQGKKITSQDVLKIMAEV